MAREARAAYRLREVSDKPMKIAVRIRNCGNSAALWSMNCGNRAVKNIVALGLVAAVRKADLYSFQREGLTGAWPAATSLASIGLFFINCLAPR
ncbi:hypothetical protein D3C76_1375040 [compost metagenome]